MFTERMLTLLSQFKNRISLHEVVIGGRLKQRRKNAIQSFHTNIKECCCVGAWQKQNALIGTARLCC
jgi:hypothetical protein